jgi:hypothetical protein
MRWGRTAVAATILVASLTAAAPSIEIGIGTREANSTSDLSVDREEDQLDDILVYEP